MGVMCGTPGVHISECQALLADTEKAPLFSGGIRREREGERFIPLTDGSEAELTKRIPSNAFAGTSPN